MTPVDELRALRWLAGPQPFADSPDAAVLGELRARGLARDVGNRIELTEEGRSRLAELESLDPSERTKVVRRVCEICDEEWFTTEPIRSKAPELPVLCEECEAETHSF